MIQFVKILRKVWILALKKCLRYPCRQTVHETESPLDQPTISVWWIRRKRASRSMRPTCQCCDCQSHGPWSGKPSHNFFEGSRGRHVGLFGSNHTRHRRLPCEENSTPSAYPYLWYAPELPFRQWKMNRRIHLASSVWLLIRLFLYPLCQIFWHSLWFMICMRLLWDNVYNEKINTIIRC